MTTIPTPAAPAPEELATAVEELAGRVMDAGVAALELITIAMGEALGLHAAIREAGPVSAADLADRLGLDGRYVAGACPAAAGTARRGPRPRPGAS